MMNNKILIEVNVPIIEEVYNVFIPASKTVYQVTQLLKKSISELTDGAYEDTTNAVLYDARGKEIDPSLIIKNSGITNGSNVILI